MTTGVELGRAGADSGVALRVEGLGEGFEILRMDANDAAGGTVNVGNQEKGDGHNQRQDQIAARLEVSCDAR